MPTMFKAFLIALLLTGCIGPFSADPEVATIQKHAQLCDLAGTTITVLARARQEGDLTESQIKIITHFRNFAFADANDSTDGACGTDASRTANLISQIREALLRVQEIERGIE